MDKTIYIKPNKNQQVRKQATTCKAEFPIMLAQLPRATSFESCQQHMVQIHIQ